MNTHTPYNKNDRIIHTPITCHTIKATIIVLMQLISRSYKMIRCLPVHYKESELDYLPNNKLPEPCLVYRQNDHPETKDLSESRNAGKTQWAFEEPRIRTKRKKPCCRRKEHKAPAQ